MSSFKQPIPHFLTLFWQIPFHKCQITHEGPLILETIPSAVSHRAGLYDRQFISIQWATPHVRGILKVWC